jgi:hypothetical protein
MIRSAFVRATVAAALALSAAQAYSASDYLLEIKGVAGESDVSGAPQTIEILSYSWGMSNPSTVGAGSAGSGKVNVQDLSVVSNSKPASVQTARESASGMATGKQMAAPAGTAAVAQATAVGAPPKVGDVATVTVALRESPTKASTGKTSRACTPGQHIKDATLSGQGKSYLMQDVVVTSCAASNGLRTMELKGHVTLIK